MKLYNVKAQTSRKVPTEAEELWLEYLISDAGTFIEAVSEGDYDRSNIRQAILDKDDALLGFEIRQMVEGYAEKVCKTQNPEVYDERTEAEKEQDAKEQEIENDLNCPRRGQAAEINRRFGP